MTIEVDKLRAAKESLAKYLGGGVSIGIGRDYLQVHFNNNPQHLGNAPEEWEGIPVHYVQRGRVTKRDVK